MTLAPRLLTLALALAILLAAFPATAQIPDQLKYPIPAPPTGVQVAANHGYSVAVEGSYTVVDSPRDDTGGSDAGVVKVFDTATGVLLHVLANPSPADGELFGWSVAISGSRVIVGAIEDDTAANNAGSAYVYDLGSATPTVPIVTLNNPGPAPEDSFGWSVAISGTRVVVGAPFDDTGASNAGSAYVYDLAGATPTVPVTTLNNPSPAAGDQFGCSVAISGSRVVVGAYADDAGATDAGSIYVYDVASATPAFPATLNNPAPAAGDFFGWSVAISGTRVVVGAPWDDAVAGDAGSAYVYDLAGATPTFPITFNNTSSSYRLFFGASVAISGPRVVVGAYENATGATIGAAFVYDVTAATPTVPVAALSNPGPPDNGDDWFGYSVAISNTSVVVGAPHDDAGTQDAGSAYIYDIASATPTVPKATLNNPGPAAGGAFGRSVAVSGTRVVVGADQDTPGATYAGSAYVYDLSSATPSVPVATLNNPTPAVADYFGRSVAISGTRVIVGAFQDDTGAVNSGSAYVYDLISGTPMVVATLNNPSPAADDWFGFSVAISGTRIVVGALIDDTGAENAGSAYVYDLSSATPTVPVATLNNPSPAAGDIFGRSVAISGTRVIVGASGDDTGASEAGSAYVYDLSSATPTVPVATLNNPSPAANDEFGFSVAISGTRVVVGAKGDNTGASEAGSAYVYDLGSATPTVPVATLNNPGPAVSDQFGSSVAISGTRVVVGALYDDTGADAAGSAYVYDLTSATPTVPVATHNNPGPAVYDNFGTSVAIDGTTIAIGAPLDDLTVADKGAAYIYGPSPYSLWKVSELSNQFTPDLGDADSDGLSNLGEYGLLRSPTIPNGAATTAAPALYAEGTRLRMFVPRDPARNDITLEVQATGDLLGLWTTIATSTLGAPFTGPGYFAGDSATPGVKSVEVRDVMNLPDAPQRFLRVRVKH